MVLVHPGASGKMPGPWRSAERRSRSPVARSTVGGHSTAFDADIIELCMRWYITYRLSYRDLLEMMADRGIEVAHTTMLRWVMRYATQNSRSAGAGSREPSAPRGGS